MHKSLFVTVAIASLLVACSGSDFSATGAFGNQDAREPDGGSGIGGQDNASKVDAGDTGDDDTENVLGTKDEVGADDLIEADLKDDETDDICRYFDQDKAGKQSVFVKFPMPLVKDPRVGPNPVPATSVPHPGAAAFISGGPSVDLTEYTLTDSGEWDGDDYRFSSTYYKDAGAVIGTILGGGQDWKVEVTFGPRLVEAEFLVTIKNAKSRRCKAVVESIPVTRGDIAGSANGCFDPKTKIKMADGSARSINLIKTGDRVFSPLTGQSYAVARVIFGPETEVGMFEVGTSGKSIVVVTQDHPFLTKDGLKQARELTGKDQIVGSEGKNLPITHLKKRPPNPRQRVHNLALDAPEGLSTSHLVEADGVVTGDLVLQEQLIEHRRKSEKFALTR